MLTEMETKVLSDTNRRNVLRARIRALKFNLAKASQHAEFADECLEIQKEIKACEEELNMMLQQGHCLDILQYKLSFGEIM